MRVRCVGAVVLDGDGRLLVLRRRNPPAAGRWSVPGGRVEPGEDDHAAVRREVAEETALEVTVLRLLGSVEIPADPGAPPADEPTVFEVHDYLCWAPGGAEPVAGDDATDARWVTRAEFERLELVDGLAGALGSWSALPR